MEKSRILWILCALVCCNCSVMHFRNGGQGGDGTIREKWHHNVALSLWEVSSPVDLTALCTGGKWSRVTTKETFITGLAGSVDEAVTNAVTAREVDVSGDEDDDDDRTVRVGFGINIWDPQMVEFECAE